MDHPKEHSLFDLGLPGFEVLLVLVFFVKESGGITWDYMGCRCSIHVDDN